MAKDRPAKWVAFDKVIRHPGISAAAKGVYALLVTYSNGDCTCFPGQDTIAASMALSVRTVRRLIKELEAAGVLQVTRRGKKVPNLYKLVTGHQCPITEQSDRTSVSYHPESDRTSVSGVTGHQCPPNSTSEQVERGETSSPPANVQSDEPRGNGRKKDPPDPRVARVRQAYAEGYEQRYGMRPVASDYGKAGQQIKQTLRALDQAVGDQAQAEQEILSALPRFFADRDQAVTQAGHPLGWFLSTLDRYRRGETAATPPGPVRYTPEQARERARKGIYG